MLHALISVVINGWLLFGVTSWIAFADNKNYHNDGVVFAKKRVKEVKKPKLEEIFENKWNLKKPNGEAVEGESCENCVASLEKPVELIKEINSELGDKNEENIKGEKNGEEILVFVSFSMPKDSLKELDWQADKYNARLLLRGLCANSFKKTSEKILEVNPNGLRLDIDPEEFRKHRIEKVPTFILIKDGKEVSRLSGNVSLEYATTKLREE